MSCTSPCYWYSDIEVDLYTQEISFNFKDSVTVQSCTVPGYKVCVPTWTSPYENCKGGWSKCAKKGWCCCDKKCCEWGWTSKCNWVKGKSGWCCCWTTPSVELWPDLTFTYKLSVPMDFVVAVGYLVGEETPPEPFICESFTIYTYTFKVDINNGAIEETVTIDCGPDGITFYAYNDYYYAQEYLTGGKGSYTYDGIEYDLDFDFYILYCLEPVAPMTWINLQVSCTMSVVYDETSWNTTFSVACPLLPDD